MAVRNRLEVTVLPQNFSKEQQEQARKNISAAAISATVSKIESSDGSVSAEAYTATDGSIHYNLKVSAEPVISDTVIYGTNGISAKNQGVNWTIGLSADYLSGNALDNLSGNWQNTYNIVTNNNGNWNEVSSKLDTTAFSTVSGQFAIKTEVQEEFEQTSAWAVETFQPKGNYLSASEKYLSANALDDLSGKWNSVYDTVDTNSANWGKGYNWIFDNSANIINASATLKTNSANWDSVYNTVETNSGNWENSYTALTSTSATWNNHSALSASKLDKSAFEEWSANADVTEYSGKDGIKVEDYWITISADYLTANALDELSGNWDSVYTLVNENSASWNETSATVNANSAKWNEASAFSANSGKFVTSALNDFTAGLAHVLTKDENDNVAWSGIDLSDLGKMYPITSLTPDIVSTTISAVDGTSAYVLSAKEPDPVEYFNISANKMSAWSGTEDNTKYYFLSGANISGNNGISAEYNPQINQWDIGLTNPSYNYAVARTDITTLTATSETISGFVDIDAAGITFENDVVTLDKGLYHVDIQVNVPVNDIDESYYEVTLTPSLSYAVLRQTIDASYAHNTTLDLSFDVNLLTDGNELTFTLAGLPVGARYKVENFQIHEVTTIDSLIDIDGGIYHAGVATQIDGQQNINVEFNPASGIDVDANNKLYVKLGKGLKFDEAGAAAGTLTLDNVTEEVVDTVQNLKTELDNKLTMNMNYSDAKKVGSPVSDIDGAGACMVASLFHVNLTHEINENTELTIYCSQSCPQSDVLPYMFGVFEYNFNYYDDDPSSPTYGTYRPQTTWLFDTGILNATIPANKYTMKVKNIRPVTSYSGQDAQGNIWINEYKAEMRSDRLYYAAMFCRQKTSNFYLLCDEGYEANTNSNPKITWFNDNMKYCGPLSATVPANIADWGQWGSTAWEAVKDTMTFDHVNWWGNNTSEPGNTYREKNTAYRYLLQVRNNNTNVGGN